MRPVRAGDLCWLDKNLPLYLVISVWVKDWEAGDGETVTVKALAIDCSTKVSEMCHMVRLPPWSRIA